MNTYSNIQLDISEGVATIWLNRPDVHNAISIQMLEEINHCFTELDKNGSIRAIVLRGKGKSFSAGADLKLMLQASKMGYDENLEDGLKWANCLATIYGSSKPVVGIATGNVYGGGNGLLAACDMVIAEDNVVFSFAEVKLGIAPSTILPYILKRLKLSTAKYLMFTGKRFSAQEAFDYGFVDFAVSAQQVEPLLDSIVSDVLKASPQGIKEIKVLIKKLNSTSTPEEIMEITASSIARLKTSDEAIEGISAFLEKRKPNWG
ncbi:enoyl-CoA hydratase-related protein [Perlabentimonas gracilis]|uniref:enoyl-CoA hydratase-related protein n=1 Tax=Perlabentimonas gracilis TaxID=2715279 RepID=UPI00140E12C3|nr:enoyl-CoA hydratase-related protein [Perlabentimonas gracilis]NHB67412.1 enoyl-CoA hydratase/isomerase family protein [Perlabentimonas gracilis]